MDKEKALDDLRAVLPHIRIAIEMAKIEVPDGTVKLGIITRRPDGSGRITADFDAAFLEAVATVVGEP